MGRAKAEMMEQDEPSGIECPVCTSPISKGDVEFFEEVGACSYCNHIMTKDD